MTIHTNLSDFEINRLVAEYVFTESVVLRKEEMCPCESETVVQVVHDERFIGEFVDYCNNWSDAGPIIAANKINIHFDKYADGVASATGFVHGQKYEHENPLRAAMIVFLMMKEGEE
jgi:Protein of unknown function (DUF2591)